MNNLWLYLLCKSIFYAFYTVFQYLKINGILRNTFLYFKCIGKLCGIEIKIGENGWKVFSFCRKLWFWWPAGGAFCIFNRVLVAIFILQSEITRKRIQNAAPLQNGQHKKVVYLKYNRIIAIEFDWLDLNGIIFIIMQTVDFHSISHNAIFSDLMKLNKSVHDRFSTLFFAL